MVRFRLYERRFLEVTAHRSAFFRLIKIITKSFQKLKYFFRTSAPSLDNTAGFCKNSRIESIDTYLLEVSFTFNGILPDFRAKFGLMISCSLISAGNYAKQKTLVLGSNVRYFSRKSEYSIRISFFSKKPGFCRALNSINLGIPRHLLVGAVDHAIGDGVALVAATNFLTSSASYRE